MFTLNIGTLYKVDPDKYGSVKFFSKKEFDRNKYATYNQVEFRDEILTFLGIQNELYKDYWENNFVFLYNNNIWFSAAHWYNFMEIYV